MSTWETYDSKPKKGVKGRVICSINSVIILTEASPCSGIQSPKLLFGCCGLLAIQNGAIGLDFSVPIELLVTHYCTLPSFLFWCFDTGFLYHKALAALELAL